MSRFLDTFSKKTGSLIGALIYCTTKIIRSENKTQEVHRIFKKTIGQIHENRKPISEIIKKSHWVLFIVNSICH